MHIIITMLRNPIHSQTYINIEITPNERFCKACKDKVEDEHHFLIQ
jgi:formylmethanofuran:tetrahydromethanopterin formyltransferase